MKLLAILSVALSAATISRAQTIPIGVAVVILDNKGSAFDLSFGSANELAPVQAMNRVKGSLTQAASHSLYLSTLALICNLDAGTYLSYTQAGAVTGGVRPTSTQLCGHSAPFSWIITPIGSGFGFVDPTSNLGATSWPPINSSIILATSPVTLQARDSAAAQQVFKFASCEYKFSSPQQKLKCLFFF
ncbi:hypothetical protein C8F01DRAFT_1371403 [Mycena amicta]|nr:hypothetical protein C8F01DRAFT_1371403 [Mycena amicta]